MDGLPFLPGFRFRDITKQNHHVSAQFRWKNGYALPKAKSIGIGNASLDVDSFLFNKPPVNTASYDPTMTYGKAKDPPKPMVESHFIQFDKKCLSFVGYTKQNDLESLTNTYRIRRVKITYFLVDDTISIIEPAFENAGYVQGNLLKRGSVPNPRRKNKTWHWSDLIIGKEVSFYGVIYNLCSCDAFTRHFYFKNGIELRPDEPVPDDPYISERRLKPQKTKVKIAEAIDDCEVSEVDKFNQFIQYDRQVLRFYLAWFDDHTEIPKWKYFVLFYYLADDQISIDNAKDMNVDKGNEISYTVFLKKMKLPVDWTDVSPNFPSVYSEPRCHKYKKYYQLEDLIIGKTIFVLGRRFFLYDCDLFTRNHYKQKLHLTQPEPIKISDTNKIVSDPHKRFIPPHLGIGDPDDTLQNCISLMPKPPRVDFIKYVLNAHKKLRYKLKLVPVYEEDKFRDFIMEYCLGNDHISISELAGKNTGFLKGRYMASSRLRKPNTRVEDNIFYGPIDFAIGSKLHIKGLVFEIVEVDLWTYKYMNHFKNLFTQEAIDGAKSFLESKGLLNPKPKDENISTITEKNE